MNPALNPKLSYKPADLAPVTKMTTSPLVLAVNPDTGIRSVAELDRRREEGSRQAQLLHVGQRFGAAPGRGTLHAADGRGDDAHPLSGRRPGNPVGHGGRHAGHVRNIALGAAAGRGGRLLAIAVSTRERSPLVPDLPGMKEAGLPEYNLEFWYGMFVPAGTPPAIVKKIYDATITAMQQPSVKASLAREGTEVSLSDVSRAVRQFPRRRRQVLGEPGQERQRQDRMKQRTGQSLIPFF